MKITLGELKVAEQALEKIMAASLPITIAYYLSKTIAAIAEELTHLETARRKLVEKYGEKDEKEGLKVTEENFPKFMEEYQSLFKEEVEITVRAIKLSELVDVKLTPADVRALGKLLEDDTQTKE